MSKIDEILKDFLDETDYLIEQAGEDTEDFGRAYRQAKQQLLELLESCKPQKKPYGSNTVTTPPYDSGTEYKKEGYNKALDEYHSNIRKLFE